MDYTYWFGQTELKHVRSKLVKQDQSFRKSLGNKSNLRFYEILQILSDWMDELDLDRYDNDRHNYRDILVKFVLYFSI